MEIKNEAHAPHCILSIHHANKKDNEREITQIISNGHFTEEIVLPKLLKTVLIIFIMLPNFSYINSLMST